MHHIHLTTLFRKDYNSRPYVKIYDDYIILVTSPYYCDKQHKSMSIYRYNLIENNVISETFEIYCYGIARYTLENMFRKIIDNIVNKFSIIDGKYGTNYSYKHNNVSFNVNYYHGSKYVDIVTGLKNGNLGEFIQGIIKHGNHIFLLEGSLREPTLEPTLEPCEMFDPHILDRMSLRKKLMMMNIPDMSITLMILLAQSLAIQIVAQSIFTISHSTCIDISFYKRKPISTTLLLLSNDFANI